MKLEFSLPIATPPWKTLGKKIESKIRKALFEFSLLHEEKPLGIALSGGKDSLTLLYMLHHIRGKGVPFFEIHAIFVDGEFSCGASIQKDFLQKVCERLNIPLSICQSSQKKESLNCYTCSRERRKLIFESAKNNNIKQIAFGHHRDDNIQTLLLNLLHIGEFSAMQPKLYMEKFGVHIIRPLYFLTEKEIKDFAKQYGFDRITCQCPIGQNSRRLRVENIIQHLEKEFPNVRSNLQHAALEFGSDKSLKP